MRELFIDLNDRIDYWNSLANYTIDSHASKRARENDVAFMTLEWKKAIRNKRKFAKLYASSKTVENYELKNLNQ